MTNWERSTSDCVLSPCLFNLHAVYIMWNARLNEAQVRFKIAGRDINNLRYVDGTTLMPEIEKKLKSLLMKVNKESENLSQNSSRKEILSRNSTFKKLSCLTYHIYLWSLRPESCDWKLRPSDGWLHLSSIRLLGRPVFPPSLHYYCPLSRSSHWLPIS